MLSLASLLNPAPLSGPPPFCFPASPVSISPATSFADEPILERSHVPKNKSAQDSSGYAKSRAKGVVNFRPHENLDRASLREVRRFCVLPLGNIQNNCRHIPYNSGKKDFYEKTGRESFEVFQYSFRIHGDDTEYTVMWDYNVGLVRMTPFFKCCKYSKTTPAKMLNMNPGLRDITHSITGGSISAQGYWMPFACAKAVCATFCHHIAGALIPIFGPSFPSECVPRESPSHGRMVIDAAVIAEATRRADAFRRMYAEQPASPSVSPRPQRRPQRRHDGGSAYERRRRFRKGAIIDSPYQTDTENDMAPGPDCPASAPYPFSPIPALRAHIAAPRWPPPAAYHRRVNDASRSAGPFHHSGPLPQPPPQPPVRYPGASPWLSAIPRLGGPPASPVSPPPPPLWQRPPPGGERGAGADRGAALLLIGLSMGPGEGREEGSAPTPGPAGAREAKRRRATSM